MKISGIEADIDVYDYLTEKGLHNVRVTGENVMACCPFHKESSPSFGVNVLTGVFNCFGCGSKGGFGLLVKLLDSFDTVFDAEEYLIGMFGRYSTVTDKPLTLSFTERDVYEDYWVDDSVLNQYKFRHPYLGQRGITEKYQRLYGIGYSQSKNAVTVPYRDSLGRLLTVKFRKVSNKSFWYAPALPRRIKAETLWGLDKVVKWKLKTVAITEGEIDALSVVQAEMIGAVAIGGNQFTKEQSISLIKTLPEDTEIVVFTDNDDGGELAKSLITERLAGRFKLSEVDWSLIQHEDKPPKDANDLTTEEVRELIQNRCGIGLRLKF